MESNKRFLVALSFPGEHREYVAKVAQHLSQELGQSRVLYDTFHEAEFARPNLARIIHKKAQIPCKSLIE